MAQKFLATKISQSQLENYIEHIFEQYPDNTLEELDPKLKFVGEAMSRVKGMNCQEHRGLTLKMNALMSTIMGMDFVKQMIVDVEEQKQMVETISAAGEENASAIEQVSGLVQQSAQYAQETTEVTQQGMQLSGETLDKIHEAYDDIKSAHETIEALTQQASEIDSLTNIISSIASQTNLLALNASIEAARSGEAGKGFAVVAAEIKKLAQSAAESASYIEQKLNVMSGGIRESSDSIALIAEKFYSCRSNIDTLSDNVTQINKAVDSINDNMHSVMTGIEEQSSATETIASSLGTISEKTAGLHSDCIKTGKGFYDISKQINGYRIKAVDMLDQLDTKDALNFYIVDHIYWKWRVYNMLLGYEKINAKEVGDHHSCRLGRWLHSYGQHNPSIAKHIAEIEKPHAQLHRAAAEAVKAYSNQNKAEAEECLKEIDIFSKQVVAILKKILKSLA